MSLRIMVRDRDFSGIAAYVRAAAVRPDWNCTSYVLLTSLCAHDDFLPVTKELVEGHGANFLACEKRRIKYYEYAMICPLLRSIVSGAYRTADYFLSLSPDAIKMNFCVPGDREPLEKQRKRKSARSFFSGEDGNVCMTPLRAATYSCKAASVEYVLERGGDANEVACDGTGILHFAITIPVAVPFAVFARLLDGGADVNSVQNSMKETPIVLTARTRNHEWTEELLRRGADPDGRLPNGSLTPLHVVCANQDYRMVRLLLSAGASTYRKAYVRRNKDPTASFEAIDALDLADTEEIRNCLRRTRVAELFLSSDKDTRCLLYHKIDVHTLERILSYF